MWLNTVHRSLKVYEATYPFYLLGQWVCNLEKRNLLLNITQSPLEVKEAPFLSLLLRQLRGRILEREQEVTEEIVSRR